MDLVIVIGNIDHEIKAVYYFEEDIFAMEYAEDYNSTATHCTAYTWKAECGDAINARKIIKELREQLKEASENDEQT